MRLFFLVVLLVLTSCVPRATQISFDVVGERHSNDIQAEFQAVLKTMKITVDGGKAYRYSGTDGRAFLVAADQFYRENPGFCPLFENAFQYIPNTSIFMTIAAKGLEVRLFVYDRSDLPRLEFAYFQGVAKEKLVVSPCRTASMIF